VRFRESFNSPDGSRIVKITQPGGPAPYAEGSRTTQLMGRVASGGVGNGVLSNEDVANIFSETLGTIGTLQPSTSASPRKDK
jgi:hypothetical protein